PDGSLVKTRGLALELPASCQDIGASGVSDGRRHASADKSMLKRLDPFERWPSRRGFLKFVKGDEVDLAGEIAGDLIKPLSILGSVREILDQDVLEDDRHA